MPVRPDVVAPPVPPRRAYIDWLRGIAVLIMVEWHAVDAWTADSERAGLAFKVLVFIGGWAAPLFLFLAGVAIPLAAQAHLGKGRGCRDAARALQRRGWQVFLLAHVFRLQSYMLNPHAVWHSIFKPDILNVLGLGMVAVAACWGRSETFRGRMKWMAGTGLAVLVIAPYSRQWAWPAEWLHPRLEAYIRPAGTFGQFSLFPWVAFMFAGAVVGLWMARTRSASDEPRFHARLAAVGLAVATGGFIGMWVPSALPTSFWTTSWSLFAMRAGVMTLLLSAAWLRMPRAALRWSPLVLFGQTSMFVYWVHVEMAFGFLSSGIKRSLTIPEALAAYGAFLVLLLWMAAWWQRRTSEGPWIPTHLEASRGSHA